MAQEEWYREVSYTEPRTQCTTYGAKRRNWQSPSLDFALRAAPCGASKIVPDDFVDSRRLARRVDSRDGVHKSVIGCFL